jgi:gamma-glutamyltranspeptidase / glutathione hydrolase
MTVLGALVSASMSDDPLDPHVWVDALSEVLGRRDDFDPDAPDLMLDELGLRSPSTITVSAVDSDGVAVAATLSAGYGSGVVPDGTGLLMNNSVGEFELIPGGVDNLVPGERMMSNMAPTTLRSGSDVVAIGSPGADRITSALAITLIRFLHSDDRLQEAVEYHRLHPESIDPLEVAAEMGLDLEGDIRWYPEPHMFFGGVNAAGLVDGELVAHADSRRVGSAIIV